jgi:nitrogen regulatory protein PII
MPDVVRVIARCAEKTDATIWVVRVDQLTRIRTGETGLDAI